MIYVFDTMYICYVFLKIKNKNIDILLLFKLFKYPLKLSIGLFKNIKYFFTISPLVLYSSIFKQSISNSNGYQNNQKRVPKYL